MLPRQQEPQWQVAEFEHQLVLKLQPRLMPFALESTIAHQRLLQLKDQPQQFEQRHHQLVPLRRSLIQEQVIVLLQFELLLNHPGRLLQGLKHQYQHQHFKILARLKLMKFELNLKIGSVFLLYF